MRTKRVTEIYSNDTLIKREKMPNGHARNNCGIMPKVKLLICVAEPMNRN